MRLRDSVLVLFLAFSFHVFGIERSSGFLSNDTLAHDTVKYWKDGGCLTLNLSQVSLSNWSAGGENSVAANALVNLWASYTRGKDAWDNTLDFGTGRLKKDGTKAVKTDDRIELMTKYGRKISNKLYYSGLVNIKTQMLPGFKYPENDSIKISDFMSPGVIFISVGIDFKPSTNFSFLLSPVTGKSTIVKSDLLSWRGSFGVVPGKNFRNEFGGFFKLVAKGSFLKIVNYQFKVDAFSNYREKPGNIDWDSELTIWVRINRFISANFKTNVLYDDDIIAEPHLGPRIQIREFVGVGFSYKFQ